MASDSHSSPARQSNRPLHSCARCSDRKVKCDRQNPCAACVKHNAKCTYRPFAPPKKRPNRVKENILNDKLRKYEAIFREQGIDPQRIELATEPETQVNPSKLETSPVEHLQLPTPGSNSHSSEPERSITKTQLVHGQGRSQFLDNGLWSRVVEEFHDPQDVLDESDDESDDEFSGEIASEDDFDFVLSTQSRMNIKRPHPSTEHINYLWRTFIENVDPLTKVVHVPTMQGAIQKAIADITNIPRGFEALMFAVYSIAVLSLTDDECKETFRQSRRALLSHYASATKTALSRARFMSTTSIVVLQALILHIFSIRDFYEPRSVWILTGVAIRIAEGMGIHHDGATWGLPPFEVEIRRRIWWQLKMHDFRTAELSGLAKFQGIGNEQYAPKAPTNVNDIDLYPGMIEPPTAVVGPTDMIFCMFKSELGAMHVLKFRRPVVANWLWDNHTSEEVVDKDRKLKEVEDLLETRFLRYCDPSRPLHLMTMILIRTAMNIGRFVTHHPRRWENETQIPESERQLIWNLTVSLLEQFQMAQSSPQLKQFWWYSQYFLPWHAFIHMLDTLRSRPLLPDAAKAWRLVEFTYINNPILLTNNRPLHVVVGNLCLKAFNARENLLSEDQKHTTQVPEFIQKLRQAREAAMARRLSRLTCNGKRVKNANASQSHTMAQTNSDVNLPSEMNGEFLKENQQASYIPYNNDLHQPQNLANDDMFWLTNGLENNGPLPASGGPMNIDTDFMLAQGYNAENSPGQAINWAQWDAWLGSMNTAAPNFAMAMGSSAPDPCV